MKMINALLVGSAAALVGFSAQAADLPKKSAPAEYVKVCNGFGAGFYMIPGSATCIQIGGFVRTEAFLGTQGGTYGSVTAIPGLPPVVGAPLAATPVYGQNNFNMGARFFLHADARTQTSMGVVRSYGRFLATSGTSGYGGPGSVPGQVGAAAILEAFIQFAGFTSGYAMSNFGYYNGDWNLQDMNAEHDYRAVQLAYTASFGNGITGTLALEDRGGRLNTLGTPIVVALPSVTDTVMNYGANKMPDLVANLNVTQAWGSAQVMGALHDVRSNFGTSKLGYAVGAGVRIKAGTPGSEFLLQAGYANGATGYITKAVTLGINGNAPIPSIAAVTGINNAYYADVAGGLGLTKAFSVLGGYNAVWSPSLSTSLLVSYQNVDAPSAIGAALTTVDQKALQVALTAKYTMAPGFYLGAELFYEKANYSYSAGPLAAGILPVVPTSTNALGLNLRVQRAF